MPKLTDSDGLFHQGLTGKDPYLGAPSVVDGLLRGVLKDVTDLRTLVLAGQIVDVKARMHDIASHIQDVFYGRVSGYEKAFFNKPNVLGHMLVTQANMGGEDDDAVFRLITLFINLYSKDYREFEDGKINDGEFQLRIQKLVTEYTYTLTLGHRQ